MKALAVYLVSLLLIHAAWLYFYLCGTLVRRPRPADALVPRQGAALVELVVTSACGMAITGFATFLLGLAHLLYPLTIAVWLIVLAAVFAYRKSPPWQASFWRTRWQVWRTAVSPGALAIYAVALVYGFGTIRPDLGGDSTSYHLVYPTEWANAHALFVDLTLRVPYYANNWLLVDVWLMMFHLADQAQTLSWLTSLLSLLGIYGYVTAAAERERRIEPFDVLLGLLAAAAVAGSTVFIETASVALIDVPIGFFFLAGVLALADALGSRSWSSLAACVLCAGFFVGMKPSLVVFYPPFAAGIAFAALRLGARRRRLALVLAALTVCSAPWYVKNFIQAGDPLAPALNIPFRGVDPHWSRGDYNGLAYDLKLGEDTSPLGYLTVPLRSLTEPSSAAFRSDGGTFIILLAWLPALLAVLLLYRRGRVREPEPYLFACLVAFAVGYWLATSYQSRYALVFLPALAAFTGALCARAALRAPRWRWAALAVLVFCAIPSSQNAAALNRAVAADEDLWYNYHDRESWMLQRAPSYPEVEAISAALHRSGRTDLRVYRAYLEFDRLFFTERGIQVAGDLFGPERYLDFQQAIYEDQIGPYVQRFHIGAFLLPTRFEGNLPRVQQDRLRQELEALGFRRASVSDQFDIYLSPEVR